MNQLTGLLSVMVARDASDLYINADAPPTIKVHGSFHTVSGPALDPTQTQELIASVLTDAQVKQLHQDKGLDFGLSFDNIGRFRINVYFQRGTLAMVVRYIKDAIPSIKDLGLPDILHDLAMEERGLFFVVGATGTGKSTTLAAMIDYRNAHRRGHILTIEDPIEFTHHYKQSVVSQREIGTDTHSYADALRFGLREAPDVIMIGEIRDTETARQALRYAETGHLCLSTMHANNANQALDRFLNFFPVSEQFRIRQDLAQHLLGIISQRVAIDPEGGRVTPVEMMMNTPFIAGLIEKGETEKIKDAMGSGDSTNCQTFDDSLYQLINADKITKAEGMRIADSRINLALRFKMGDNKNDNHYLTPQKHWLSKSANFNHYKRVAILANQASLERRPDMEAVLTEAIKQGVKERGYNLVTSKPDLLIKYAFGLHHEKALRLPAHERETEEAESSHLEGGLIIQGYDGKSGEIIWHLVAKRAMGKQLHSQQEINIEIANLIASLPLARS
ncbi:PilT/PilU family type 4a pilus ATPase [Simiduia litorea]|uniref:PilT/PilU family type 4a pilus ATPase n=1 Tax=Simiduia litorea TaxID=1435348 RepID=UPI0036F3A858